MQAQGVPDSSELPVCVLLLRFPHAQKLRIADAHHDATISPQSDPDVEDSASSARTSTPAADDPTALSASVDTVEIHADIQTYDRLWWLTLLSNVQNFKLSGARRRVNTCMQQACKRHRWNGDML